MSLILHIETSSEICSVALGEGNKILALEIGIKANTHAESLFPFIQKVMEGYSMQDLQAIAISAGPGSYTGLRIGTSAAKGMCYALNIPLIAIPTVQIIANDAAFLQLVSPKDTICVCVDARRMEVYYALLDKHLNIIQDTKAEVITSEFLYNAIQESTIYCIGNGLEKIKEQASAQNIIFVDHLKPSALKMASISMEMYKAQNFADTAYFEPYYSKEFYTNAKTY